MSVLAVNADGSVDLYVGPEAPTGMESNWIPTQGKRPFPVMRMYGPDEAFWDKSFKLMSSETFSRREFLSSNTSAWPSRLTRF
jgi:hypothetical protein